MLKSSQRLQEVELKYEFAHTQTFREDAAFSNFEYGREFDTSAKYRMVSGCRMLAPWIEEKFPFAGKRCIEFGPFRDPLLLPERMPGAKITYIDGDAQIVAELREQYHSNTSVKAIFTNLNSPIPLSSRLLEFEYSGAAIPIKFDVLVASQILNYINHVKFLGEISKVANLGAILFINNVIDYGIPELFSEYRPKSDDEVIVTLKRLGWSIERRMAVQSQFSQQLHPRMLVIAKRINAGSI